MRDGKASVKIQTIKFPGDEVTFASVTWTELHNLTFVVAKQMMAARVKVDRIVTLAKGGWTMTRALVDFLEVPEVASIGVRFYTGINERLDKPEVYQDLPISIKGERVLLFDDIADTGASLLFAKKYLEDREVKQVLTACPLYKPHSTYKPDFYGAETSDWVIFPYDVAESVVNLSKRWQEKGIEIDEIKNRLSQLHFESEYIEYYSDKN